MNIKTSLGVACAAMILGLATMSQAFEANKRPMDSVTAKSVQKQLSVAQNWQVSGHSLVSIQQSLPGKSSTHGAGQQIQTLDTSVTNVLLAKRTKKRKVAGRPTASSVIDKKNASKQKGRKGKDRLKIA